MKMPPIKPKAKPSKVLRLVGDDNPLIRELNQKHAVVSEGGKVVVITERLDPQLHRTVIDRSSASDFRLLYGNRYLTQGRNQVPLGQAWLEHPLRRQYDQLIFDPTPDRKPDPTIYNLFKGFPVRPVQGEWPLFRQHLLTVGANGDPETLEFLLDWCAFLVQRPHLPAETAIVWRGAQGAGKGVIARTVGKLVGQHFVQVANVRYLVGHFNGHLHDALLVFSDEAFFAGDKASEGALKSLITEKSLLIERKGRDAISIPNRIHLIMATNHEWAVPMGLDDRRFLVVDVPDTECGNTKYFRDIHVELETGGLEAFMFDLMHRFIGDRPPAPPKNAVTAQAALAQKTLSMSAFERWWFEKIQAGQLLEKCAGWPEDVQRGVLHDDYLEEMEKLKVQRRVSRVEMGILLRKLVPNLGSQNRREGYSRTRYWLLPPLEQCRTHFATLIKQFDLFSGEDIFEE